MSLRVLLLVLLSVILLAQYEAAPREFAFMGPSLPYEMKGRSGRIPRSALSHDDLSDITQNWSQVELPSFLYPRYDDAMSVQNRFKNPCYRKDRICAQILYLRKYGPVLMPSNMTKLDLVIP